MKKSGKLKSLLYGIPVAIASFLPMKSHAQERIIIDPFSQPNDITLDYYGSGDVNQDNVLNWDDYYAMDSVQNDMSDIDGDEVSSTVQDKQLLENYLNQKITHLPAQWNKLDKTEKTNWLEKMLAIDKTRTIASTDCNDFAIAREINFNGYKSLGQGVGPDFPWQFNKNGRFNIPMYLVSTTAWDGSPHAINATLVGENPDNFYDLYSISNLGDKVSPGDPSMAKDSYVTLFYIKNINPKNGAIDAPPIIQWHVDESGVPTLEYNKPYVIHSNPNKDASPPEINLSFGDSTFYTPNINLEYLVKDSIFLDSVYYKLDNNLKQHIPCDTSYYDILTPVDSISGTIPLELDEGEHNLEFYARDIAKPKNESSKNIKLFVDRTSPDVKIIYPESKDYVGSVDSMVFSISDAHLDNDSCWYSVDGGKTKEYFPCSSGERKTVYPNFSEGTNTGVVGAKDKATNYSQKSVKFNVIPVTAIEKNSLENYLRMYPNPVSDVLKIEGIKNAEIKVYDITGKQLEKILFKGDGVDMRNCKPGVYIIKAENSDGKIYTGKVVKK